MTDALLYHYCEDSFVWRNYIGVDNVYYIFIVCQPNEKFCDFCNLVMTSCETFTLFLDF